jgi:hypothetical protein
MPFPALEALLHTLRSGQARKEPGLDEIETCRSVLQGHGLEPHPAALWLVGRV